MAFIGILRRYAKTKPPIIGENIPKILASELIVVSKLSIR